MWNLQPEDRLKAWKIFRLEIKDLPIDNLLDKTEQFWHKAPYVPFYLDSEEPKNWPDPWTLIYEKHFCDIAKGLGVYYTLLYCYNENIKSLEFRIYKDATAGTEHGVVWINNGEQILKSQFGCIINTQQEKIEDTLVKIINKNDLRS